MGLVLYFKGSSIKAFIFQHSMPPAHRLSANFKRDYECGTNKCISTHGGALFHACELLQVCHFVANIHQSGL
jgi:hypothetical protein